MTGGSLASGNLGSGLKAGRLGLKAGWSVFWKPWGLSSSRVMEGRVGNLLLPLGVSPDLKLGLAVFLRSGLRKSSSNSSRLVENGRVSRSSSPPSGVVWKGERVGPKRLGD